MEARQWDFDGDVPPELARHLVYKINAVRLYEGSISNPSDWFPSYLIFRILAEKRQNVKHRRQCSKVEVPVENQGWRRRCATNGLSD